MSNLSSHWFCGSNTPPFGYLVPVVNSRATVPKTLEPMEGKMGAEEGDSSEEALLGVVIPERVWSYCVSPAHHWQCSPM